MRKQTTLEQAFTLIELLVVIAIVGILSGLIIVGMSSSVNNARIAKAQIFSASLRDSLLMNLVSEWKFDGSGVADGGTATIAYTQDTWGSNNGSIGGTPLVYSGSNCVYGSCIQFTAGAYISVGNDSSLNTRDSVTAGLWIKTNSANPPGWLNFINTNGSGNCDSGSYCLRWNGPSIYAHFYTGSTTSMITFNQALLNDNNWHYVTAVYNGTNTYYYLDGQLRATGALTGQLRSLPAPVYIGNPGAAYSETIDEVRIFSAAIPASQIREQYYSGIRKLLAKDEITKDNYEQKLININKI